MIINENKDNDNNSFTIIIIIATVSTALLSAFQTYFTESFGQANETGDL